MSVFLSIIIPTLNEQRYIPILLESLTKQKEKNFETIIVDGFSQDKTIEEILKYKNKIPLKYFQIKPNLSYQKNYGAKKSQGAYLCFVDADMKVSPSFTKIAKEFITKHKGLIFLPYVLPLEKKEFPELTFIFPILNELVKISQNFNKPFSSGPAMIFEKNFFRLIGGFDNLFGEDHFIIRKSYHWGVKAKILPPTAKVHFSLRRMKKEGRLKLITHFIGAHFYLLLKDKLNQKLFKYDMGGQVYNQQNDKQKKLFDIRKFKKILHKI